MRGRPTDKQSWENAKRAWELRKQGLTFLIIGVRLGVTKQAAHKLVKKYEDSRQQTSAQAIHFSPY